MASRNPVLIRATGESFGGETIEQGSLTQPEFSGARLTMDDVIVKTGMLFALLLVGAFVGWSSPGLTFVAFFLGLGLAFANIFKKQVSPGLVLAYGAAEGVFLGGLSKMYATAYADTAPNLVSQAVMGTLLGGGEVKSGDSPGERRVGEADDAGRTCSERRRWIAMRTHQGDALFVGRQAVEARTVEAREGL